MAMDKEAADKGRNRNAGRQQQPPNRSSGSNDADVPLTSVRVDDGPADVSVDIVQLFSTY